MSQIIVFDRSGKRIGFLRASVQRWWTLNEYGQATFEISVNDPKANAKYLRFGNWILIRHPKLPDWGGVIDTPRDWDYSRGVITVTAYGGEYLLSFRRPESGEHAQVLNGSPGANFTEIIAIANRAEDLNIRIGEIEDEKEARETKLIATNPSGLYDDVVALAEDAGFDWDISPALDSNGRMYWKANWRKHRGKTRTFVLQDTLHLTGDLSLSEQGKIINDLLVVGDGNSSNKTPKSNPPVDDASRDSYGLRQGTETVSTKDSDSTLKATGEVRLAYWKQPRSTLTPTVLDVGAAFENIEIGDSIPVRLSRAGFAEKGGFGWTGTARVTMMDYSDDENDLEVSFGEVTA